VPVNRRSLFYRLKDAVSGSFLLGTAGGAVAGSIGTTAIFADPQTRFAKRSYSQNGEDVIVESICRFLEIPHPTYLDIGAADPVIDNNTYLFYRRGCRGVLVEPNPTSCRKLGEIRPGDTVLNVGIGFADQEAADYYMISGPGGEVLNTFSREEVNRVLASFKDRRIEKTIKMPLVNINKVMEKHFRGAPTFVSIDTEGLDLDIIKSLEFDRFRPPILCVETIILKTTKVETRILDLMQAKGYAVRGGTFANTIFIDNRLL
jgi:FkbM family methyltransferase